MVFTKKTKQGLMLDLSGLLRWKSGSTVSLWPRCHGFNSRYHYFFFMWTSNSNAHGVRALRKLTKWRKRTKAKLSWSNDRIGLNRSSIGAKYFTCIKIQESIRSIEILSKWYPESESFRQKESVLLWLPDFIQISGLCIVPDFRHPGSGFGSGF